MKVCTKCGICKPFSEYTKHKLGQRGLRPRCKDCCKVENAAYRARTVARRAEYNKRYRAKNREHHVSYNKAWNRANRDRMNAIVYAYRRRNPDLIKARRALAHAIRRSSRDDTYSTGRKVLERVRLYGGKCFYCGDTADTIDHRIPLVRGGSNLPANLVPACRSCNSSKGSRPISSWRGVASLYRAEGTA